MTKKKRGLPDVEEILQRPWCYYCERDFDDLKILISHQKAKHFKCERCGRRLNTVGGLSVHMNQVHKESLTIVENALPNRSEVGVEIFGMEGIPEDVMSAHQRRITEAFFRREAERRAATGNPGPGGQGQGGGEGTGTGVKKPKIEGPEDIKKRLAEHKARKLAEKMGLGSGNNTPAGGEPADATPMPRSPEGAQFQPHYTVDDSSSPPPGAFNPYQPPPQQAYPPFAGSPINARPFQTPGFSPSPYPAMGAMGQGYPQPPPNHFPSGPPHIHFPPGPPRRAPWPAQAPKYQPQWSPPTSSGPPVSAPGMTPGLPQPAPGLPQRPSFNLPNLSKEEMAKMHSGGMPSNLPMQPTHHPNGSWTFGGPAPPGQHNRMTRSEIGDEVDDLINSVTGQGAYRDVEVKREDSEHQSAEVKREPSEAPVIKSEPQDEQPPAPTASADNAMPVLSARKSNIPPWPKGVRNLAPGYATDEDRARIMGFKPAKSPPVEDSASDPAGAMNDAAASQSTTTNDAAAFKPVSTTHVTTTANPANTATDAAAQKPTDTATDAGTHATKPAKKSKKDKKNADASKMIYSDNATSPEEKMAQKSRYAFDRNAEEKTEFVLDDISGAVTGEMGEDVVRDPQD